MWQYIMLKIMVIIVLIAAVEGIAKFRVVFKNDHFNKKYLGALYFEH